MHMVNCTRKLLRISLNSSAIEGKRTKENSQLSGSYHSADLAAPLVKLSSLGLLLKSFSAFKFTVTLEKNLIPRLS